jgi:two-component system, OmpR family, sensor histidine kinase VicK
VGLNKTAIANTNFFVEGGGELGELTRSFDWASTSVGDFDKWPQSLRTIVSIILSSKFPMFLWWGGDLIQFYNDAYRPSLGNSGKHPAALGQKGVDCWPEIWPVVYPLIQKVFAGEAVWSEDQLIPIYRNGRLEDVYWTFSYSPVRNDEGKINGVLVVCNESTEKVLSHAKLAESERNLRNVIYQSPVAMCILRGPSFIIEIANEKVLELWGVTAEVIGKPLFEGVPTATGQGFEELLENVLLTGETFTASGLQFQLLRKGKMEKIYINLLYQAWRESDSSISGIFVIAIDITEEAKIRHKIEVAEERARLAIGASGMGTFDKDFLTGILITSPRFDEIFGYNTQKSGADYFGLIYPEDTHIREDAYKILEKTGKLYYECRIIRTDKSLRWIRVEGVVYKDAEGKPLRLTGIVMDITDSKYLSKQKDDFIGVASHELKTPVTTIKAYIQILEEMLKIKGEAQELSIIKKVDNQVDKLTTLINNMLDATKMVSGRLEYTYSNFIFDDLIKETVTDLQITTRKKITMELSANNCTVRADKEKVEQAITNLLNNANKFSPHAENIVVRTFIKDHQLYCDIQDFGIGISDENKEKIFQQFYRINNNNKNTFPGIGLGLYISSEIIKREGGKMWVTSKEGEGSTFSFSLPCLPADETDEEKSV